MDYLRLKFNAARKKAPSLPYSYIVKRVQYARMETRIWHITLYSDRVEKLPTYIPIWLD